MTILNVLIQLSSGAMLLLFSVRFVRIGIERLWNTQIRASLSERSSMLRNLVKGAGLGFIMRHGGDVDGCGAGGHRCCSRRIGRDRGVGADMGSALAVQFLQLPVSALRPLAILAGATAYLRAGQPKVQNFGRVVLGLGLIFLSLSIIRAGVEPVSAMPGAPAAFEYLNRDATAAALAGIALTLLAHSSVAAILMAAPFAGQATLEPVVALTFVLGCNFGSALLPLWLLKHENGRSKAVAVAVAAVRCGTAIVLVALLALAAKMIEPLLGVRPVEAMLVGHLVFNLLLLAQAPLCASLGKLLEGRIAGESATLKGALPAGFAEDIGLALPVFKRKLSGMLDIASGMLEEVSSDRPDKEAMDDLEQRMNASLADIREVFARLPAGDKGALNDVQQILDLAIRVKRCGDVLSGKYLTLRLEYAQGEYRFTEDGDLEIARMIDAVRLAIILAHETAWTGTISPAERLVRHKQYVADLERESRARHLARLRRGNLMSFGSSNQHLETIAALKEINSKFATIGYAILARHGALKKTRIKSSAKEVSA